MSTTWISYPFLEYSSHSECGMLECDFLLSLCDFSYRFLFSHGSELSKVFVTHKESIEIQSKVHNVVFGGHTEASGKVLAQRHLTMALFYSLVL